LALTQLSARSGFRSVEIRNFLPEAEPDPVQIIIRCRFKAKSE
jgi:hypothetical protein